MASPLQQSPYILYSDGEGNIYEDTSLYVVGRTGWDAMPIDPADWIELPEGEIYMNYRGDVALALMLKRVKCVCVIRDGPLPHLFLLRIRVYILPHMKQKRKRLHYPYFATQQQVG